LLNRRGTWTRSPTALWPELAQANSIFLPQANLLFATGQPTFVQAVLWPEAAQANSIMAKSSAGKQHLFATGLCWVGF